MMGARLHLWSSVAFAGLMAAAGANAAAAQTRRFDVPAQRASTGIPMFAHQAGIQILVGASNVEGMSVNRVEGALDVETALRVLLAGTDLTPVRAGNAIVLRRRERSGSVTPLLASAAFQSSTSIAATQDASPGASDAESADAPADIVVTGQRASLTASRNIKRNADQVVDSLVADDIGKFPDNSVAAALQRVPGVQVVNGFNNEIQNPIVRGLGDILTTLDGREIFTGVGRGFSFQDLPAEAIAGVDVYKSNSAELIEGGIAGSIDMKLQKPFNFKKGLTVATNLRGYYGDVSDKASFTAGLLAAARWDTGIGEMGLLADVSYQRNNFSRPISFNCDPRSGTNGPPGASGTVLPTCVGGLVDNGRNTRPQVNAAFQWRPTPDLEVYADALYAGYRARFGTYFIFSDLFAARSVSNVGHSDDCFTAPVNGAGFTGGASDATQDLCLGTSATFNDVPGLTSTQAKTGFTDQYVFGGGLRFNRDAVHLNLDLSYISSTNGNRTIIVDTGRQIGSVDILIDDDGHGTTDMPGNPLGSAADFRFANTLFQEITRSESSQYAAKLDAAFDVQSDVLRQFQVGVRYNRREADFRATPAGGPAAPGGNRNTLVDSVGLPSDFMQETPATIPYINGGASWYTADRDFLLDQTDRLRAIYGGPAGDPAYDPVRNYDAREETVAAYVQGKYQIDLGGDALIDGLGGVRVVRSSRRLTGTTISFGAGQGGSNLLTPTTRDTVDTYVLPNASIRYRATRTLQFRGTYAKTLSRPAFGDLNPGLSLAAPTGNPNIILSGSGGNPDLRAVVSDNFDVTAELYFGRSSSITIAGYYRDIKDRVAPDNSLLTVAGQTYRVSQPRNVGASTLKGIEVATQTFFDFLPAGLDGLGVLANFTYADSEITTSGDPLEGQPLLGVSKYAYTAGGLYEKYGVTARVVYTWRDGYSEALFNGGTLVGSNFDNQFNRVKANGRLDFSVAYDITPNLTLSVDGVNVLGGKYYSYFDTQRFPHDIRVDDRFYGASVRARF